MTMVMVIVIVHLFTFSSYRTCPNSEMSSIGHILYPFDDAFDSGDTATQATPPQIAILLRSESSQQRTLGCRHLYLLLKSLMSADAVSSSNAWNEMVSVHVPLSLRCVLDDSSYTTRSEALRAMALMMTSYVSHDVWERCKAVGDTTRTVVPSSDFSNILVNSQTVEFLCLQPSDVTDEGTDADVECRDVVTALVSRTHLLTRLSYILTGQYQVHDVCAILQILIVISCHSPEYAAAVCRSDMIKTVVELYHATDQQCYRNGVEYLFAVLSRVNKSMATMLFSTFRLAPGLSSSCGKCRYHSHFGQTCTAPQDNENALRLYHQVLYMYGLMQPIGSTVRQPQSWSDSWDNCIRDWSSVTCTDHELITDHVFAWCDRHIDKYIDETSIQLFDVKSMPFDNLSVLYRWRTRVRNVAIMHGVLALKRCTPTSWERLSRAAIVCIQHAVPGDEMLVIRLIKEIILDPVSCPLPSDHRALLGELLVQSVVSPKSYKWSRTPLDSRKSLLVSRRDSLLPVMPGWPIDCITWMSETELKTCYLSALLKLFNSITEFPCAHVTLCNIIIHILCRNDYNDDDVSENLNVVVNYLITHRHEGIWGVSDVSSSPSSLVSLLSSGYVKPTPSLDIDQSKVDTMILNYIAEGCTDNVFGKFMLLLLLGPRRCADAFLSKLVEAPRSLLFSRFNDSDMTVIHTMCDEVDISEFDQYMSKVISPLYERGIERATGVIRFRISMIDSIVFWLYIRHLSVVLTSSLNDSERKLLMRSACSGAQFDVDIMNKVPWSIRNTVGLLIEKQCYGTLYLVLCADMSCIDVKCENVDIGDGHVVRLVE